MAAFVIFGVLAAFGALVVLWVLFGLLLPGQRGTAMVHLCRGREEAAVRRYDWLRDLGLLRCPLILVDCPQDLQQRLRKHRHDLIFCGPEELPGLLEQERKNLG